MSEHLLYSTNVHLKFRICRDFRKNIHYVWCSGAFDSTALGRYDPGSGTPPTANPADIYRRLKSAVERQDRHDEKINQQRNNLLALAVTWVENGEIKPEEKEEIFYIIENASFKDWRPLVYVIPRHLVEDRLRVVPIERRASDEVEYIIEDLGESEFDIIEP